MPGFLFYYRRSVCRGEHLTRLPYFPKKRKVADNQYIINHLPRAENGTRTRDLNLGKVALYQLSYFRKMCDLLSEIAFAKIDKKNGFPNSERQKIRFFVILGCTSDVVCW